ncbi:MAG: hypothetical protein M0Z66_16355 [Thermaerobacter sp.]|nr:hypothetical protein [Thermaerobacter sp.]
MQKVPPVAPVAAKGPLGVVQLPRLWSKVLLDKKGLLPEGYSACGQGFDRVVLEGLGLDRERVLAFLDGLPTYPQFEAWVTKELGGSVPQDKIQSVNDYILGREFPEERRRQILESVGYTGDEDVRAGAALNQLDDWAEFHRYLIKD